MSQRSWKGLSGRTYHELSEEPVREGPVIEVQAAIATGPPRSESYVSEGSWVAVRHRRSRSVSAKARFKLEAELFKELSTACPDAPCPRMIDIVHGQDMVLITEWCPSSLENWWYDECLQPDAFEVLCTTLADVCKRVADCRRTVLNGRSEPRIVADLRPRSLLKSQRGDVRISGFRVWGSYSEVSGGESLSVLGLLSPEELFGAVDAPIGASDVWAIGSLMMVLLRVRSVIASGARVPAAGLDAPVFFSHRSSLIRDLHTRKPGLFVGRPLDPRQFMYPERLPDQDRRSVDLALVGVFGSSEPVLEKRLSREVCRLLDRALHLDPKERISDVLDLAREFDDLTDRMAELSVRTEIRLPEEDAGTDSTDTVEINQEGTTGTNPMTAEIDDVTDSFEGVVDERGEFDGWTGDQSVTLNPQPESQTDEQKNTRAPAQGPGDLGMLGRSTAAFPPVLDAISGLGGHAPDAREFASRVEGRRPPWSSGKEQESTEPLNSQVDAEVRSPQNGIWLLYGSCIALIIALFAGAGWWFAYGGLPLTQTNEVADVANVEPVPDVEPVTPPDTIVEVDQDSTPGPVDPPTPSSRGPSDNAPSAAPPASGRTSPPSASSTEAQPPPSAAPRGNADPQTVGAVEVSGASGYLVGPSGQVPVGQVTPGQYQLFARLNGPDQPATSVATLQVRAGRTYRFRCGFGVCRRQ